MKRTVSLIFTFILILSMAASAMAGGPPPKDLLKGYFTEVNEVERSVQFVKEGSETVSTLYFNHEMSGDDIRLDKKVMVTLDKHAGDNVIGDISIMFMDLPLKKRAVKRIYRLRRCFCHDPGNDDPWSAGRYSRCQ